MKFTALNSCRRHALTLVGVVLVPMMFVTSCKKDQDVTPETSSIGTETLRHHRHWNDTVKNSPGTISSGTVKTGTTGGTTTTTGGSTSTGGSTTGTTTTGGTTTKPTTGTTTGTTTTSGTTTGTTTTGGTTTGTTTTGGTTTKPTTGATTTTGGTTTKPTTGTTTTTGSTTTKPTTGTTAPVSTAPVSTAVTYKASAAITMVGKSNVTIRGLAVPSITLNNCTNVRIVNCKIGPSTIDGVLIYNSTGVTVDSCLLSNVRTGVNAVQSTGIVFSNSQGKNMKGPYPHGQFVQYNNVTGGGNKILNNKFENIMGQSDPEDAISIYQSSGLASDPIVISGNSIRGGGPSHTGGGIMLGDGGGANVIAENNTLVDPGQYGMAISGGTNMSVINNSIYGKAQSFTNVGLYYWNQSGKASSGITISGNKINFMSSSGQQNNTWLGSGATTPTGWSTNVLSKTLGESLLPAVLTNL